MASDDGDFKNDETSAVVNLIFLQCKAPNGIHAILKEKLQEHTAKYANNKLCVAQSNSDYFFFTCDTVRPVRSIPKTTP
jgi:hypothetical protein